MILDDIVLSTKKRYDIIKEKTPLEELLKRIDTSKKQYPVYEMLERNEFIYICECKHASPSKGIIKEDYNYLEIAKTYEANGASAISCLTEPEYFLGSDEHLLTIKKNVSIPVLRKDFIIDSYQIYESKALGADMILLIVAILTDEELKEYLELAHSLGLCALVETHSEAEIERAIQAGAKLIGVNNRNLKDFSMDYSLALQMKEKYPNIYMISESGLRNKEDVANVKRAHMNGVLIGESLMKSENIAKTLKEYKNAN